MDWISELFDEIQGIKDVIRVQIELSVNTSTLSEERKEEIIKYLPQMDETSMRMIMDELRDKQLDNISRGYNYSQTDIKDKLRREI